MQNTKPITAYGIEPTPAGLRLMLPDTSVFISWDKCSQKLAGASTAERLSAELSPGGYGIHWPLLDEDLSVGGLIAQSGH